MAALTGERKATVQMGARVVPEALSIKQKGATTLFKGAIVALNGGYAAPGAVALARPTMGVCMETSVNSGADGAARCKVRPGVFKVGNSSAGDLIADIDVGNACFVVDDQTVAKTNGGSTRSAAGTVIQVDSDGVWVLMGPAL